MDRLRDIRYFFEDNSYRIMPILKTLLSILGLLVILGLIFGWFGGKEDSELNTGFFEEGEDYEILSYRDLSLNDSFILPDVDILLLNPVMEFEDVEMLVKSVERVYERKASERKKKVVGFDMRVYQREVQYELDLIPVGVYSKLIGGDVYDTNDVKKIPKDDMYVVEFDYEVLTAIEDIEVYDADDILIETVEVPDYVDDEEYLKLLKIHEYNLIFGSRMKAIEFYVFYDLNVVDVEGVKFDDRVGEVEEIYRQSISRNEYLPELDKEELILDYRENHIDVWSNIVVYRGY